MVQGRKPIEDPDLHEMRTHSRVSIRVNFLIISHRAAFFGSFMSFAEGAFTNGVERDKLRNVAPVGSWMLETARDVICRSLPDRDGIDRRFFVNQTTKESNRKYRSLTVTLIEGFQLFNSAEVSSVAGLRPADFSCHRTFRNVSSESCLTADRT